MKFMRGTAGVLGVWLLFNLVAMPLWWGGMVAPAGPRHWAQVTILIGFGLLLLFDLISGALLFFRSCVCRGALEGDLGRQPCHDGWLLVLAVLAVMGLAGAKVMVDEIGRETVLGWAGGGEWGILYTCLTLQLAYLLALLFLPSLVKA